MWKPTIVMLYYARFIVLSCMGQELLLCSLWCNSRFAVHLVKDASVELTSMLISCHLSMTKNSGNKPRIGNAPSILMTKIKAWWRAKNHVVYRTELSQNHFLCTKDRWRFFSTVCRTKWNFGADFRSRATLRNNSQGSTLTDETNNTNERQNIGVFFQFSFFKIVLSVFLYVKLLYIYLPF